MIYLQMKGSSVVKVRHDLFYRQRKFRVLNAPCVDMDENAPVAIGISTGVLEVISTTTTCVIHSH